MGGSDSEERQHIRREISGHVQELVLSDGDLSSKQRPELEMDLGASIVWTGSSFPAWMGEEQEHRCAPRVLTFRADLEYSGPGGAQVLVFFKKLPR